MDPITNWKHLAKGMEANPKDKIGLRFYVDPSYDGDVIFLAGGKSVVREGDADTFAAMCSWEDLTNVVDPLLSRITHRFITSIETCDGIPLLSSTPRQSGFELEEMGPSEPRRACIGRSCANGINLEYRIEGSGPLVVVLHDLFDTNPGLIEELAESYTVAAPKLPGFGLSDKMKTVPTLEAVADTMAAFIEGLGGNALVIGHGYGGTLAWVLAYRHPDLISSIISVNGPHPVDFAKKLGSSLQLFRSWNFFLFQIPYLPQWILKACDGYLLKATIRSWSHKPHALDIDEMAGELLDPGVLDAALQYYRGALRGFKPCQSSPYSGRVEIPVNVIWGENNPHFGINLAQGTANYTTWIRSKRIPHAGHWLAREAPDDLAREIKDMLA